MAFRVSHHQKLKMLQSWLPFFLQHCLVLVYGDLLKQIAFWLVSFFPFVAQFWGIVKHIRSAWYRKTCPVLVEWTILCGYCGTIHFWGCRGTVNVNFHFQYWNTFWETYLLLSCHRANGAWGFKGPAAARITDLFKFIIFIYCSSEHVFLATCATLK